VNITAIPRHHKLRLLDHTETLRRLKFTVTPDDLMAAYVLHPALGTCATKTLHANTAGLLRFLKLKPGALQPCLLAHPSLFRRSPQAVQGNIHHIAGILGLAPRRYVRHFIKYRGLVNVTPSHLHVLIESLQTSLDLDRGDVIAMIRAHVPFLTSNPGTLVRNAHETADALGLPFPDYVKMARRLPGLLAHPAATLRARAEAFAMLLRIDYPTALRALRRAPPLLALSPATIAAHASDGAKALGVDTQTWSRVLLKRPNLCGYPPETLVRTVAELAALFNVSTEQVIGVALRHPAILQRSRSAMEGQVPLVLRLCHALGFPYSAADTFLCCPLAYTYANARLESRCVLAQAGVGPRSIMNLLSLAEQDAQLLLKRLPASPSARASASA